MAAVADAAVVAGAINFINTMAINRFLLQWHITDKCSNHCLHCYIDDNIKINHTDAVQFPVVIDQFKDFLKFFNQTYNACKAVKGHINITGGDPLMHPNLDKLLELLLERQKYFSYGILANATYINVETIAKFKKYGTEFIQLSLDGNKDIHDHLRGKGDFQQTINALSVLKKHNIKTYVSFTANQLNYQSFGEVAAICRKYKVAKLWTDRYIPLGDNASDNKLHLSSENFYEFIKQANALNKGIFKLHRKNIFLERALMFQITGEKPYNCSAGKSLLAIMPDGTVYPCRRLPIACGNIFRQTLIEIYKKNDLLMQLQNPKPPKVCQLCSWYVYCKSGARCMSHAITGTIMQADPDCAIAKLYVS